MIYFFRLILKIFIIFIITVCCYGFIKYIFWEPSGIKRGSPVYHLKIPDAAKNFPIWGERGKPLYDLRIADGEKPRLSRVRYTSALDLPGTISRLKELSFKCPDPEKKNLFCFKNAADSTRYEISLKETPEGTEVKVDIIGEEQ